MKEKFDQVLHITLGALPSDTKDNNGPRDATPAAVYISHMVGVVLPPMTHR